MTKYSNNALAIYERLYFDELREETDPIEVHRRVAKHVGNGSNHLIESFFDILDKGWFRPNSPCLINAGRKSEKAHDKQLCACFVLGLQDSMESIIEMWSICAKIYASGAGAGIPITNLREYESPIASGGVASGPLKYLKVVDTLSDTVRSGGRSRRAANLGAFKHNHPETIEIINSKSNTGGTLTSFNLSMSVTDGFMKSAINSPEDEFDIISPNNNAKVGYMKVGDLWQRVIENAYDCGDPGLLFIDQVNKFNSLPSIAKIESTNPCGEVPLPPWSVCNIGSINLNDFVRESPGFATDDFEPFIEWDKLHNAVFTATYFLDNVIDTTAYIHERFEHMCKRTRPIGLGLMGFADILIKLAIPYGSKQSMKLFEEICFFINKSAIEASIEMCESGRQPINIPEADYEHFCSLLLYYTKGDKNIMESFEKFGIRNSTWTCIAPTGSISMSADCSYAWEPLMALVWEKPLVDSDQVLKIINPAFEKDLDQYINENNPEITGISKEKILDDIVKNHGSIQGISYLPDDIKKLYIVAHDVDPMVKIEMQGYGQKWISLAISSTCNLPNSATIEDIDRIYKHAYKCKLKGITIFRDGCLETQIVNFGKVGTPDRRKELARPIKRQGETVEIKTPYGNLFVTCNFTSDKKPFEIFYRVGKQGALTNVLIDALGRVCSKALQKGMSMDTITDTLRGLKGEKFWFKIADDVEKAESAESIIDAISQVMEYHWSLMPEPVCIEDDCQLEECPQCHRKTLRRDTGCRGGLCTACGHSNCG